MTVARLPGWLRLWLHPDPSDLGGADAYRAALARRAEVTALAARARAHRRRNHFAERIAGALDTNDQRSGTKKRRHTRRRKGTP